MVTWQQFLIIIFAAYSFVLFIKGFIEARNGNSFGQTVFQLPIGAFVWADAVVFGIFWTLVNLVVLAVNSWVLFLLVVSVFWTIRGLGETIYWLNQQYSTKELNPPERFKINKLFKGTPTWFVHQIFWQCITIVAIIFSIYFAKVWF